MNSFVWNCILKLWELFRCFPLNKTEKKKRNEIIHGKNTLIISPVFETEKPSAQFFITQKGHISRNFEF